MPFDLRCPDCRAKLRLDDKPGRDDPVECPKCGGTFTPAESAAADRAEGGKPAGPDREKKPKKKKKEKEKEGAAPGGLAPMEAKEREFFNPFALLGIIAVCLAAYVGACWFVLNQLGKSGRVEDMVAFVPKDCNTVRGANLLSLNKYPGYKAELDKYETPPLKAALDELAKAAGLPEDAFQDYMVYGKNREKTGPATLTVFAFRCKADIDPAAVKAGLGATDEPAKGGPPALRMPATAPGILAGALVDIPTRRHVVIAPRAGNADQAQAVAQSRTGAADKSQSFVGVMGDVGQAAMRGHGWLVVRAAGGNQDMLNGYAPPLKEHMPALSEKLKDAKVAGLWNSFGGSVRFGGALDCGTPEAAAALAKALKTGPLGSEDQELPRGLKQAVFLVNNKEFGAMRSDFSFRSSGTCAYYTSGMQGEFAKSMLMYINLPTLADGGSTGTAGQ